MIGRAMVLLLVCVGLGLGGALSGCGGSADGSGSGSAAGSAPQPTAEDLIGQWTGKQPTPPHGEVQCTFKAGGAYEGQVTMAGAQLPVRGTYQVEKGRLKILAEGSPVKDWAAFRVEGDTLTIEQGGKPLVYTRAR